MVMKTNTPARQTRTIRLMIPTSVYARLAFLAAGEGVSIPRFVHAGVVDRIAQDGFVPLPTAPEVPEPGDDERNMAEPKFDIDDL
jgi:hypothetical protein